MPRKKMKTVKESPSAISEAPAPAKTSDLVNAQVYVPDGFSELITIHGDPGKNILTAREFKGTLLPLPTTSRRFRFAILDGPFRVRKIFVDPNMTDALVIARKLVAEGEFTDTIAFYMADGTAGAPLGLCFRFVKTLDR